MLDRGEVSDLEAVQDHTEQLIVEAVEADQPVLVESPPVSGKSTTAYGLPTEAEKPVTYLAGREDLYREAEDWCEENADFRYEVIPSPHRNCDTFTGEKGNTERVRKLYHKGISALDIHEELPESDIPCHVSSDCTYLRRKQAIDDELTEIDLLIGHHRHSLGPKYITDRVVVVDELNPESFLRIFPSQGDTNAGRPGAVVSDFVQQARESAVDFPADGFGDLTSIIENRDTERRDGLVDWFREYNVDRQSVSDFEFFDVTSYRHDKSDLLAPFLLLSLVSMEQLASGIARAPPTNDSGWRDIWEECGAPRNWVCSRDRNTGEMFVLQPPALEDAEQIIGLDALPTVDLWNLLYAPEEGFLHQQTIPRSEFTTYLAGALNMTIKQAGNGMHHYAGGRISKLDEARFAAIAAEEGEQFALISTKKALEAYAARDIGIYERYVKPDSDSGDDADSSESEDSVLNLGRVMNHGKVKSSNTFDEESLGVVAGTPYPGDDVVRRWAALCGRAASPEGEGEDKSFGEEGDPIYHHFTYHQVVQAVLRFGRDRTVWQTDGATVYLITEAVPEWFEVQAKLGISTDLKKTAIAERLIESAHDDDEFDKQTVATLTDKLSDRVSEDITEKHVRNTLQELHDAGVVAWEKGAGYRGEDHYWWIGDDVLQPLSDGRKMFPADSEYYVIGSYSRE